MGLYENVERMWFGTEQKMGWIETPQTGADVSSLGQSANATLLGGGGVQRNSWDSHKTYSFSWGVGANQSMVSLLQAYRNGSYGRGLLYFHDPMFFATNLLPKRWADPSMAVNFEAEPLIPDANPTAVPLVSTSNNYPVNAAQYTLPGSYSSQTNSTELFFPIPEDMVLVLGASYSEAGRVYVRTPAGSTDLVPMGLGDATVVNTVIRNQSWARIGIRNPSSSASSITIAGMTARLVESVPAGEGEAFSFTNSFTNPSFEAASGTVEVARNYVLSPFGTAAMPGAAGYPTPNPAQEVITGAVPFSGFSTLPVAGHPNSGLGLVIPAGAPVSGGVSMATALPAGDYVMSMWVNRRTGPTTALRPVIRNVRAFGTARTFSFDVWTYVEEPFTISAAEAPAIVGTRTTVTDPVQSSFVIANMQVSPAGQHRTQGELAISGAGSGYDSDMTPSFTGAANASASVLTGVGVAGVSTSAGAVAIRSSQWMSSGSYSLRLISRSTSSTAEYAVVGVSGSDRGTVVVTRRQSGVITGPTWAAGFGRVYWNPAPQVFSPQAPNAAGEFELRVYAAPLVATSSIILPHGGLAGSGDVWYDMLSIVAGVDYVGPAFSGDTPGASWDGTPNASASTLSGTTPISGDIGAGPWYSGEGHSGCRFDGNPTVVNYNGVGGGQIGLSANFVEVGAWE